MYEKTAKDFKSERKKNDLKKGALTTMENSEKKIINHPMSCNSFFNVSIQISLSPCDSYDIDVRKILTG